MKLSIALCEPMYEVNVGHVARLMMNFGLNELFLIDPKVDLSKARIFAVHAASIVDNAKVIKFENIKNNNSSNEMKNNNENNSNSSNNIIFDMIIGTTSIPARDRVNIVRDAIDPKALAERINIAKDNSNICLLLGRESIGLTNEELASCDVIVSIDTPSDYKALNISHALAILLYEIFSHKTKVRRELASKQEIELLTHYALKLARISNVREHKIPMLEIALKRIISRGIATSKEVMLLITLLRSAILTIQRKGNNKNGD